MTTVLPNPTPSYRLFVGIDIAAVTAKAAWLSPGTAVTRAMTIDQTPQDFAILQHRLLATGYPAHAILVVMEATGAYWMNLATTLHHEGFIVSVINPGQAHHFAKALLKRAKTDAIDAQTLAQLASLLQPPPWTPPPAIYTELQQRLAERDSLLEVRQQVRNQLHALGHMPLVVATVRTRMEQLIETLTQQIEEIDQELELTMQQDKQWAASAQRLQTIIGIGPLAAAWLLVSTLNFTLCSSAEALSAYAGLVPHPYQSGTSVHGRASIGHTGNARLRTILYMATLSATQHNPIIKAFYDRLRAAGKPMKVARCAAARKLVHLAYAVITHEKDFDSDYQSHKREQAAISAERTERGFGSLKKAFRSPIRLTSICHILLSLIDVVFLLPKSLSWSFQVLGFPLDKQYRISPISRHFLSRPSASRVPSQVLTIRSAPLPRVSGVTPSS